MQAIVKRPPCKVQQLVEHGDNGASVKQTTAPEGRFGTYQILANGIAKVRCVRRESSALIDPDRLQRTRILGENV